jgi:hypothetical protein
MVGQPVRALELASRVDHQVEYDVRSAGPCGLRRHRWEVGSPGGASVVEICDVMMSALINACGAEDTGDSDREIHRNRSQNLVDQIAR